MICTEYYILVLKVQIPLLKYLSSCCCIRNNDLICMLSPHKATKRSSHIAFPRYKTICHFFWVKIFTNLYSYFRLTQEQLPVSTNSHIKIIKCTIIHTYKYNMYHNSAMRRSIWAYTLT